MMQLRFTYTLPELAEAIAPPGTTARALQSSLKLVLRDLVVWLAVILLAVVLYLVAQFGAPKPQQPAIDLMLAIAGPAIPAIIVVGLLISVMGQGMRGDWQTRRRRINVLRSISTILILLGLLLGVYTLLKNRPVPRQVSRGVALLITLAPTGICLLFMVLAGRLLPRGQLLRQWDSGIFSSPKTLELSGDSISFSDSASNLQCRWSFFQHAKETANLLLLIARDERIYLIPKRAFASAAEITAAKAIIQNNIPQAEFLASQSAFPVMSTASSR